MNWKEKIKNYGFWTSLSAAVVLIAELVLSALGKPIVSASVFGEIVMAICSLLVVLGIVSNPKEGKWWIDSTKTEMAENAESKIAEDLTIIKKTEEIVDITKTK
ncbi:MAG: phage holin [Clostridia bacterium]